MMIKFLAVMMMALMTNLAFGANPEVAHVRTDGEKADIKVQGIKNDSQEVKKDTQKVSKDVHQIKK